MENSTVQPPVPSIMVVDDTPANLRLLTGMLKERGYKVRPVANGKFALQTAKHDPPDLILLDILMPEMNGYEVCERLKAEEQLAKIPVIFISALDETMDKVKAFKVGGVDYVTKPFQFEEVEARVATHLELRRQRHLIQESYDRLRESRDELNRAQAVAHTGSWRLDVRRNELLWSEENGRMFGVPKGTPLTYETFLATVYPEDRDSVDTWWKAVLRGAPYDIEHRIVVGDAVKWVRERAVLEFAEQGVLFGVLGTTQDITERKRAEEALYKLHAELETRVQERTAELAQANEGLRAETAERVRAEEKQATIVLEERTRIAREIHDTLAQGFTGIVIQLEAAEDALADDPEAAHTHLLRARELARESLAEARRSVWALRPQALERGDLVSALASLAGQLARESSVEIEFSQHGVPPRLSHDMENNLLRLSQEALTNALKHARASSIRAALIFGPQQVELRVEDDGQGFDPSQQPHPHGFGFLSMTERAERMGGQLIIDSQPGQGTRVVVLVPVLALESEGHAGC